MQMRESDFGTAAYLLAKGILLIEIDSSNPRRKVFVFDNPEGRAEQLRMEFLNQGQVAAITFYNSEKQLRTLMREEDANANRRRED